MSFADYWKHDSIMNIDTLRIRVYVLFTALLIFSWLFMRNTFYFIGSFLVGSIFLNAVMPRSPYACIYDHVIFIIWHTLFHMAGFVWLVNLVICQVLQGNKEGTVTIGISIITAYILRSVVVGIINLPRHLKVQEILRQHYTAIAQNSGKQSAE